MLQRSIWRLAALLFLLTACAGNPAVIEETASETPAATATALPVASPTQQAEPATATTVPTAVTDDPAPATAETPAPAATATPAAAAAPETTPVSQTTDAETVYATMTLSDGTVLEYALVLPANFDAQRTYPVLLALPPGAQTREMVTAGLDRYWEAEAQARGYVVVSPVAPNGVLFFEGADAYIPEFLQRIAENYRPEGGKFHLAGVSNGGISAFRVAMNNPELFLTLQALPGVPRDLADFSRLDKITAIPTALFVGGNDTTWSEPMQQATLELAGLGGDVSLEILPGEGHVLESLSPARLFGFMDSHRP